MTIEEAIKVLRTESVEIGGNAVSVARWLAALDVAVKAWEDVPDKDDGKNEPMTLDELRQMDGEPVWWWNKSAKPVCTICVWDRFMDEPMFANYDWQSEYTLQLSKYKWLKKCGYKPYRQKPEEDDHDA